MAEYLSFDDVEAMSMALKTYDVDQGGWEHEDKGLEFNVNHVLKELVRAERKDFFHPDVVRTDLAPDAMQYALRLARWTGFNRELVLPSPDIERGADAHAILIRTQTRRIGAFAAGQLVIADFVHRLDHASERSNALRGRFDTLPAASQALMLFALDSANEFDFRPRKAFSDRLASLRERFGISQPTS